MSLSKSSWCGFAVRPAAHDFQRIFALTRAVLQTAGGARPCGSDNTAAWPTWLRSRERAALSNRLDGSSEGFHSEGTHLQENFAPVARVNAPRRRQSCSMSYAVALPFSNASASPKLSTTRTCRTPCAFACFSVCRTAHSALRPSNAVMCSGVRKGAEKTVRHSSGRIRSARTSGKPSRSRKLVSSLVGCRCGKIVRGSVSTSSGSTVLFRGHHSDGSRRLYRQRSLQRPNSAACSRVTSRSQTP